MPASRGWGAVQKLVEPRRLFASGAYGRHFYIDLHRDGFAIPGCGREFPRLHGLKGGLVKVRVEGVRNDEVAGQAIYANDKTQYNGSLEACACSLRGYTGSGE